MSQPLDPPRASASENFVGSLRTLTLSRRNLEGNIVETTEWVRKEEYEKIKDEADRLRKTLINSDRLLLVDGDFEAFEVGTYNQMKYHLERIIGAGDELDHMIRLAYVSSIRTKKAQFEAWSKRGHSALLRWQSAKQIPRPEAAKAWAAKDGKSTK